MDAGRLADLLRDRFGGRWRARALGASAFCDTWRADGDEPLFVKTVPAARADVLEAEADGLAALAAPGCIAAPRVAGCWTAGDATVLALAWIGFAAPPAGFGARLGEVLGALHAAAAPGGGRFGWFRDNRLGATPQPNGWSAQGGLAGWIEFVGRARLAPFAAGLPAPLPGLVARVVEALPAMFDDGHVPRPSLIHGDLWSGNRGCTADGAPVVFDPAVSVSDAEAELAMMTLFGEPPDDFWPAYRAAMPVAAGAGRRRHVYQLVHLLNHARLFGGGYGRQAAAAAQAALRS